jgi:hypothetical protein
MEHLGLTHCGSGSQVADEGHFIAWRSHDGARIGIDRLECREELLLLPVAPSSSGEMPEVTVVPFTLPVSIGTEL